MPTEPAQKSATYTCPMHPEVQQEQPGKCPKCGMDLVPESRPHGGDHSRHVQGKPGQESRAMADHAEMVRQMRAPWLWTNFTIIAINRVRVKDPEEVVEFFEKFKGRGALYGVNSSRQQVEIPFVIR